MKKRRQMRISVREWMQADGNIRADGALIQRPADADPADCAFLFSEEDQQALVDLHVDGIISHLDFL